MLSLPKSKESVFVFSSINLNNVLNAIQAEGSLVLAGVAVSNEIGCVAEAGRVFGCDRARGGACFAAILNGESTAVSYSISNLGRQYKTRWVWCINLASLCIQQIINRSYILAV